MMRDYPLGIKSSNHVHKTQNIEKFASSNILPRSQQNTEGPPNCSLDVNDTHSVCPEQPDISEEQVFQGMWRLFSTPKNHARNQTRVSLGDVSSSFQALFFGENDHFTLNESSSDEKYEDKMKPDTICTRSQADLTENARKNMFPAKELVQFFSKDS